MELIGRDDELGTIVEFLDGGPSRAAALLLDGPAGIGKTTLWLHATELAAARSYRVLVSRPAESDAALSFAGVGDLLSGVLDEALAELPRPQRSALEAALLLADADAQTPDQGALSFAFLNALRALARESPTLLAIDDIQWLDAPSARLLWFAANRLHAEPVRLLLALRSDGAKRIPAELEQALPGRVQTQTVGPLSLGALFELLRTSLGTSLSRPTLRQLHQVSRGNPLHALEIARALDRGDGRIEVGEAFPVPEDLQQLVGDRVGALPARVREALLVAAVSSDMTLGLLESVTGRRSDLRSAIDAQVIAVDGDRVRFAHPLFASAIRQQAGTGRLRQVHLKLAEHATTAEERAHHLALGTVGPDERAAGELVEAARAARSRGAPIASAAFFEHALRLSPPAQAGRIHWETELAETRFAAGDTARAAALLTRLADELPAGRERAAVLWRLAMVTRSTGAAPAHWLAVAEQALAEAAGDPALEAAIHCEVSWAALFVNDLERGLEHARTAVRLSELLDDPEIGAQAADSLVYMELTAGIPSRPELMERALELERAAEHIFVELSPSLGHGFELCLKGELVAARSHLENAERLAREGGDESGLAVVCGTLATLETLAGDWKRADAYAQESVELAEHTGVNWHESLHARALLDAHLGRVDPTLDVARELVADAEQGGSLVYIVRSYSVLGFLELSRRHLGEARAALKRATDAAAELGIGEPGMLRCVPDYVETLLALGERDEAERLVARYEAQAEALGRDWAQATAARCRGVMLGARGELPAALVVLEQAVAGHRSSSMPFELGRTLLALGAVQRRGKQRRAARESLAEALEIFEELGAALWAEKAREELGRIAGRVPSSGALTPAEARIAERVARGLSNREVAAELVIAVHTVEAALTRIYGKLGVRSRAELVRRFAEGARQMPGAL